MKRLNLFSAQTKSDEGDPPGYRSRALRVSAEVGAERLAVNLFEIPPGESLCPYHYEYEEEWLVVLDGRPTLRHPDGEDVLEPGDAVCFPKGPDGAHKVSNDGGQAVRMMMFSAADEPAVAVYPDSNKIGIWPGRREDHVMVRRSSHVEYYDGERG